MFCGIVVIKIMEDKLGLAPKLFWVGLSCKCPSFTCLIMQVVMRYYLDLWSLMNPVVESIKRKKEKNKRIALVESQFQKKKRIALVESECSLQIMFVRMYAQIFMFHLRTFKGTPERFKRSPVH